MTSHEFAMKLLALPDAELDFQFVKTHFTPGEPDFSASYVKVQVPLVEELSL